MSLSGVELSGTSFFFFSLSRSLCAARQDRWRETLIQLKSLLIYHWLQAVESGINSKFSQSCEQVC